MHRPEDGEVEVELQPAPLGAEVVRELDLEHAVADVAHATRAPLEERDELVPCAWFPKLDLHVP
jgi:hypothetical protein